jgi:arginine metabolism regulation protein II
MEGTTNEVLTHLQGCERLLKAHHPGVQVSCNMDSALDFRHLDTTSCFLSTIARTTLHQRPDLFLLPTKLDPCTLYDTPFTEADSYLEFTYGITSTVASFVYLTSKFWFYSRPSARTNSHASAELDKAIATLQSRLGSWTAESERFTSIATGDDSSLRLVRHLAESYHSASQIYFHLCFPSQATQEAAATSPRPALPVLSQRTLFSLEEAEATRSRSNSAAGPIAWPGFVAACVAPPRLRWRWAIYWETQLKYRIGSLLHVWEVVKAVWKQNDGLLSCGDGDVRHLSILPSETEPFNAGWTPVLQQMNTTILAL